jgi:predicted Zn-dependent protease
MKGPLLAACAAAIAATALASCGDGVGVSACFEPEAPYSWALGGNVALTFRWPANRMPVRVYAEPGNDLPQVVQTSLAVWRGGMRCGELTTALAADSLAADIVVRVTAAAPVFSRGVILAADSVGACAGVTQAEYDSTLTLTGPLRSYVWPISTADPDAVAACYRMTVTHELGHALGILNHSAQEGDIMYSQPRRSSLSLRDRATAQRLYHSTPSIRPKP